MTRCPYCQHICNPLRLMIITKWTPYSCAKCDNKSDFSMKTNKIIGSLSVTAAAGLGYPDFYFFLSQNAQPWYIELATFMLVFVAIMTFVKGFFLKLYPI